jgi:hypothetical protein
MAGSDRLSFFWGVTTLFLVWGNRNWRSVTNFEVTGTGGQMIESGTPKAWVSR